MADSPPGSADENAPTIAQSSRSDTPRAELATSPEERYQLGRTIGRGGMGEVVVATDVQIGREVAIKRLHETGTVDGIHRFLREARIQGRLEHPAIVPVHELSVDRE